MNKIFQSLVIALSLSHWSAAINAEPVIPDAGLIMRESSKMPVMPKKNIDTEIELLPQKKPMAAQNNLHVLVRGFSFNGNSQFSDSALQLLLSHYTNRELSFADLQQAAAVITEYYRKAGFMSAYAYLPEQTLERGQVELVIFEGQLDVKRFKE